MKMPDKIPFVLKITGTRGAIGKCYVIRKDKRFGYYMSRYPNMKNIIPSDKQKKCRRLFREALDYAMWINANPQRKQAFLNTLTAEKRRWMPHRWMVKYYMKASPALRVKLKARMQRSKLKLKPAILHPRTHAVHQFHWKPLWQKPGTNQIFMFNEQLNSGYEFINLYANQDPELLI